MADLVVPALGESITEATVARWLKAVGEPVQADEPLVDLETDKVTVQLPAPAAGAIREQRAAEGETVAVGQVIGLFEAGAVLPASAPAASQAPRSAPSVAPSPPPPAPPAPPPPVAPALAAVAAAAPPPVAPVSAGPAPVASSPAKAAAPSNGRPLSPAQRKARREAVPPPLSVAPAALASAPVPASAVGVEEVVPMTSLRRRIAQRLVTAQQTAAILTTFNEVDMSRVMALRSAHQQEFVDAHGVKLGFMSFFAKASVAALREFPGLNAEVREDAIAYKKYYHIGVAVGGGRGLVVPVLRNVDRMSFAEIESAILELAKKARDNKLALAELQGGTFTISNGGVYGSMMSTPLLNFPQTGILGMHNIVRRPVAVGDAIEIRPMMYIALSYDHRVVDGREAVQFLLGIKNRVENPDRLLFDL